MKASVLNTRLLRGAALAVMTTAACGIASAQTVEQTPGAQAQADDQGDAERDVVTVTGTLIRGVAPTGTNVINVDSEAIVETGVASANDLLASIPQISNFGTAPVGSSSYANPIVRPNIRNLGASGGSTTLVLMNGHRLVGAGVLQTTADPSIIPPDALRRVEVVPDGGSSIYGSDAIGGVVNFITIDRYDGVALNGRYSVGDNYQAEDLSAIIGKDWGTGSAYLSYAYAWHDNILGAERDYITANHVSQGGTDQRTNTCYPGNITVGATTYALPGRVAGTLNRCDDAADYADFYPREERNSFFGGFSQQISDGIDFSATAYWSKRETIARDAQGTASGTISSTNPYFSPIGAETSHSVAFSLQNALGTSNLSTVEMESYGVTPELTIDLPAEWRLTLQANIGRSENLVDQNAINAGAVTAGLAGTTTATALNPYNPALSNPAVLAAIRDFTNYGQADQSLDEIRAVFDGTLFQMPAGDVKLAVGAEYHEESIQSTAISGTRASIAAAPRADASREVSSLFAEALFPLVANGGPGLRNLDLSVSARYDSYSDAGDTTNPKIGINYEPFDGFVVRANYGTSYHAPSLADTTGATDTRAQILTISPFRPASSPFTDLFRPTIILAGGNPDTKPEEAETYSLGFDWEPEAVPGLRASVTYFNVDFTDAIGLVPVLSPTLFTDPNYAPFLIFQPTQSEAEAITAGMRLDGAASIASLYSGTSPYIIIDARRGNLGAVKTDGLDFNIGYQVTTDFGDFDANIAGTHTLNRETQAIAGQPYTDALANGISKTQVVASVGWRKDAFSARGSLNYRDGYDVLGIVNQTKVDSFTTLDLFFSYAPDFGEWTKGSLLTFNIDNVTDEEPPYLNNSLGYTNGSTLGRVFSVGIRKSF